MKLFIVDGIDNSGKSSVVRQVVSNYSSSVQTIAFPSKSLSESPAFLNVATNPTQHNKNVWLDALIAEERTSLHGAESQILLIDRMWISTLIYQGDSGGDFDAETLINRKYESLMRECGILPEDVHHFVFRYPMSYNTEKETNVAKKTFDKKRDSLFQKQEVLLAELSKIKSPVHSPYLTKVTVFDEPELRESFRKGEKLSRKALDGIQFDRANTIESYIQEVI